MLEDQCTVRAAETEGILHGVTNLHRASGVGTVIQIAFGILFNDINRRRRNLILHCQDCEDGFNAAGTAQQVTGHGLCGVDHELLRGFTKSFLDRLGFIDITDARRSSVSIQVINVFRFDTGASQGHFHAASRTVRVRSRDVTCVTRQTVTHDLSVNVSAASQAKGREA